MADYKDSAMDAGIYRAGIAFRYKAAVSLGAAAGATSGDLPDLMTALRIVGIGHDELEAAREEASCSKR